MTDAERKQIWFESLQDLRGVLGYWNATSDAVKRSIIEDAIRALELAPLPDDLVEQQ